VRAWHWQSSGAAATPAGSAAQAAVLDLQLQPSADGAFRFLAAACWAYTCKCLPGQLTHTESPSIRASPAAVFFPKSDPTAQTLVSNQATFSEDRCLIACLCMVLWPTGQHQACACKCPALLRGITHFCQAVVSEATLHPGLLPPAAVVGHLCHRLCGPPAGRAAVRHHRGRVRP